LINLRNPGKRRRHGGIADACHFKGRIDA